MLSYKAKRNAEQNAQRRSLAHQAHSSTSLTIQCVLSIHNVFSYYRMCSYATQELLNQAQQYLSAQISLKNAFGGLEQGNGKGGGGGEGAGAGA